MGHLGFSYVGLIFLLMLTTVAFHRIVTSELMIIHIWAALELSAVAVLYGIGHFEPGQAAALAALVGIAFIVGLICYVLYYRLDGMSSYQVGSAHDGCGSNGCFPGSAGGFIIRHTG